MLSANYCTPLPHLFSHQSIITQTTHVLILFPHSFCDDRANVTGWKYKLSVWIGIEENDC